MRRMKLPVTGCRLGRIAVGLIAGMLIASSVYAQAAPAAQAQAAPPAGLLTADAGMVLNFIKADKTADFESIVAKLKEGMQKSEKPERKQQAAGWKVFKAAEPGPGGAVLYVFIIDPAVKDQTYSVSTLLAEAFPTEVQALYKQYADCYAAGQSIANLTLVSALGQ